ncbi:hypothetical protein BH09PSE2_BH09PSE2_02090 [soil metagenome]
MRQFLQRLMKAAGLTPPTGASAHPVEADAPPAVAPAHVAPPTPFLDAVEANSPASICEVVVEVRNPCNFRCFYCVAAGHNNTPVERMDLEKIRAAYENISADIVVTSLECGGGEPTVHPQFPELLALLRQFGPVSFPSNNSQNPKRWMKGSGKGLLIRSSLHPESETEKGLERYLDNAKQLVDQGAFFLCQFIAHPTRLDDVKRYQELFAARGVPFSVTNFIGEHDGKPYPHSYTRAEKEICGFGVETAGAERTAEQHMHRNRNFNRVPCDAGFRSIHIRSDGALLRCLYDQIPIDAPFAQAEPCSVEHCGCGMLLKRLNTITMPNASTFWMGMAGMEAPDTAWIPRTAEELGYSSAQDALFQELTGLYDHYMRLYGHDVLADVEPAEPQIVAEPA